MLVYSYIVGKQLVTRAPTRNVQSFGTKIDINMKVIHVRKRSSLTNITYVYVSLYILRAASLFLSEGFKALWKSFGGNNGQRLGST